MAIPVDCRQIHYKVCSDYEQKQAPHFAFNDISAHNKGSGFIADE